MANKKNTKNEKIQRKGRKHAVIMLAAITTAVWFVFLVLKIVISKRAGIPFSAMDIIDGVFDNILGILPPIIIFNFAFEYFTQDYVSDELSAQITSTLMSDPETIKLFEDDAKRNFLKATVSALSSQTEDEANMAMAAIDPYIKSQYNLRKYFRYNINLRSYPSGSIFGNSKYMMVCETLKYTKQYISSPVLSNRFKIGFFVENSELDKHLRGQEYLMRESLVIAAEDLEQLIALSPEERIRFVKNEMSLSVFIDHKACEIVDVYISRFGIDVVMESSHSRKNKEIPVDINFFMPQLKKRTTFFVSITEPTYSPGIQFTYPREDFHVTMYPFFSDTGDALVEESDRGSGTCDVFIQEKWVYPMSGIVFVIDELSEN